MMFSKVFVVWLSLKMLRSRVLASFTYHRCLPHSLEELSMDRRNSSELFLRRRVCTLSNSFCRMTGSSQFSVNELLSFLAWFVHNVLIVGQPDVVMLCIVQLHTVRILVITPVHIVPCTLLLAVASLCLGLQIVKAPRVCTVLHFRKVLVCLGAYTLSNQTERRS